MTLRVRALRVATLLVALSSAMSAATAQTYGASAEGMVTSDVVSFQCEQDFTGHGIGVCSGRIDASLRNVRQPLKMADFRCEVLVRYWWWEGREKRSEIKTLDLSGSATRLGMRFADATIEFQTDLTSVVKEPQGAYVLRNRCEVDWRT